MSLSEEEQEVIIQRKTTSVRDKEINRGNTDDENVFTERGWCNIMVMHTQVKQLFFNIYM